MGTLVAKEGKLYYRVSLTKNREVITEKEGSKEIEYEEIEEIPTATAGCSRGMKISKNYQSAEIACWVTLPCKNEPTSIRETLEESSTYVEDFLTKLLAEATKDLRELAG
jgi:hypothetical protein